MCRECTILQVQGFQFNGLLYQQLKCFCIAFTPETGGKTHGGKMAVFLAGLFEIDKVHWVETSYQIADCLTKSGASTVALLDTLQEGKISY